MSSDQRLTTPTRKEVSSESVKQLVCKDNGNSCVVLTYCGAGKIGQVEISDWIRHAVRGQQTIPGILAALYTASNNDLGVHIEKRIRHTFTMAGFYRGEPFAGIMRNFDNAGTSAGPPADRFVVEQREVGKAGYCDLQGFTQAVSEADKDLLNSLKGKHPRDAKEFASLLASINERAGLSSNAQNTISPHCVVTHVRPDGLASSSTHGSFKPIEPTVVPTLLFGIDFTDMQRILMRHTAGLDEELQGDPNLDKAMIPRNILPKK